VPCPYLIGQCADAEFVGEASAILRDICATPITPELLPLRADGAFKQETEDANGSPSFTGASLRTSSSALPCPTAPRLGRWPSRRMPNDAGCATWQKEIREIEHEL
jgi:hypothetical protein